MANIFRQAKELIQTKNCGEFTDEETKLLNTALLGAICLLPKAFPVFDELPISVGLEVLARMTEEAR